MNQTTSPIKEHQNRVRVQKRILKFFGKSQYGCVCMVDIVDSTNLVLSIPEKKTSILYSTFLNNMADIVEKHSGKIVKNLGDALLFYFPDSLKDYQKLTLNCGMRLLEKRNKINDLLTDESLPSISYRVSSDCGKVLIGYSSLSATMDIFGSAVNVCSKINSMGMPNEMVIGNNFYEKAKSFNQFNFSPLTENKEKSAKFKYPVYNVSKKPTPKLRKYQRYVVQN